MIVIDSEPLILYIVGMININYINRSKRTSIYSKLDFELLQAHIGNASQLLVPPNVWTETDNHLNDIVGHYNHVYYELLRNFITSSTEKYVRTNEITNDSTFSLLGITDTVLLRLAKKTGTLITGDSQLSNYATSIGIKVYDTKEVLNSRL